MLLYRLIAEFMSLLMLSQIFSHILSLSSFLLSFVSQFEVFIAKLTKVSFAINSVRCCSTAKETHISTFLYCSLLFWSTVPAALSLFFPHSPSIVAVLTHQHPYICTAGWVYGRSATCGTSICLRSPLHMCMRDVSRGVNICVCVWIIVVECWCVREIEKRYCICDDMMQIVMIKDYQNTELLLCKLGWKYQYLYFQCFCFVTFK